METKEVIMDGKNPSPEPPSPQTLEEGRVSSAPDFFEKLKVPVNRAEADAQRKLTPSEFLELLRKQEPESQFPSALGTTADGNSQATSSKSQSVCKDKQDDKNVAINQCNITSAVDYGSRDYYYPSTHTSETPYTYQRKEKEFDESHKTCTDTRGNWWEGSFNY